LKLEGPRRSAGRAAPAYLADIAGLRSRFRKEQTPCEMEVGMRLALEYGLSQKPERARWMMRCCTLQSAGVVRIEERLVPQAGPREAIIQVKLAAICAADCLVARGEYPVRPGLILGHEGVGVVHELGTEISAFELGDRVRIHAVPRRDGIERGDDGWCLGHTLDGTQAEFVRVPDAEAFLERLADCCSDYEMLMLGQHLHDARRRFLFDELELAYHTLLPGSVRCSRALVEIC
jgi:hypothetical protein